MINDNKRFAVSSSVRFFRNVSEIPFVSHISPDDADDLNHNTKLCANSLWGEDKYTVENYCGFDTLDELKKNTKEKLEKNAENRAKSEKEAAVSDWLCENIKANVPEVMVESEIDNMA